MVNQVLGIIKENEADDAHEPTVLFKKGFPIPQKTFKSNNTVEKRDLESSKLKWTMDSLSEPELDNASKRFDFQGRILETTELLDTSLYHHGLSPSKPGYTLAELVHLSKSTVPSQRVVAFKSLTAISINIQREEYLDCKTIYQELNDLNVLIAARVGLDASHDTVMISALALIAEWLGFTNVDSNVWDELMRTICGFRTISLQHKNLKSISLKFHGKGIEFEEEEFDSTINGIAETMKIDPVMGLLLTNIVPRFNHMLQYSKLDIIGKKQIIYVLKAIARHSPSSAEDILASTTLIDYFKNQILGIKWPSNDVDLVIDILELFIIICQSSREACVALHNITMDTFKFLTCFQQCTKVSSLMLILSTRTLQLIAITLEYQLDAWIIDYYRPIFMELSIYFSNNVDLEYAQHSFSQLLNLLTRNLISFSTELDAGGTNDSYKPFVEQLLSSFSNKMNACRFLLTYFQHATKNLNYNHIVMKPILDDFLNLVRNLKIQEYPVDYAEPTEVRNLACESGIGLVHPNRIAKAKFYLRNTHSAQYVSVLIDALTFLYQKGLIECLDYTNMINSRFILHLIDSCIYSGFNMSDWIAIFAQGDVSLIFSWISANDILRKKKQKHANENLIIRSSLMLISRLIYGDEYLLSQILNKFFFSGVWIEKQLEGSFLKSYQSEDLLNLSKTIHMKFSNEKIKIPFLMFDVVNENRSKLPLPKDWLYGLAKSKRYQATSIEEIRSWLQLIVNLENGIGFSSICSAMKLYYLMHTFFLINDNNQEIFRDELVNSLLKQLLMIISDSFDETIIEEPTFFNTYEDLIDHFDSVSFGDKTFASYLFVPITYNYNTDFHEVFWTKLSRQLRIISADEADLPWKSISYYIPKKVGLKMKNIYKKSLSRIHPNINPALWKVANSIDE